MAAKDFDSNGKSVNGISIFFFLPKCKTQGSHSLSVVLLLQIVLHFVWQRQLLNQVYPGVLADDEPAQVLQGAHLHEARHRVGQPDGVGGRARQARPGVTEGPVLGVPDRVLDQVHDRRVSFHVRLFIKAKPTI